MTISEQIAELAKLDQVALVERYVALHGREPRCKRRDDLFRRCAWTLQERALGGLSGVAKRRLDELVSEISLPSGAAPATDKHGLRVGTEITREWRGQTLRLVVRDNGYEVDGALHGSLSAAAFVVTGTRWNGKQFWQVGERSR